MRHVERREEGTLQNNIKRKFKGKTVEDMLRKLEEELAEMRIRVWRKKAQERSEWATIMGQALVIQVL